MNMKTISANGANIPAIGFGTWTLDNISAERMVLAALETGYRHIDTASMYGNEIGVGRAIASSELSRETVFVTTKIWYDDVRDGALQASIAKSLERLKLDYIDLALIHWPHPSVSVAEMISALNDIKARGWTKHIGVSNFTTALLTQAIELSEAPLACNQIEYHAMLNQQAMRQLCDKHGLSLTAYCPMAQGRALLDHPAITTPAKRLGLTAGQIALNWLMRQGNVIAIPRTSRVERLAQNLDVFDIPLTSEELTAINALQDKNMRVVNPDFAPNWD